MILVKSIWQRYIYLIFALCFLSTTAYAKYEIIDEITSYEVQGKFDSASILIDSIIQIRDQIIHTQSEEDAYYILSRVYGSKGNVEWGKGGATPDSFYIQSIEYAKVINDSIAIGLNYCNLGILREIRAEYAESVDYYIQAYKYLEKSCIQKSRMLDHISYSLSLMGKNDEALEYIRKALRVAQDCGDQVMLGNIYNAIGSLYTSLNKEADSILFYLNKAQKIANESDNLELRSINNSHYGDFYFNTGQFEQSLKYNQISLEESEAFGDLDGQAESLRRLGFAHGKLGDMERGIAYYDKALKIVDQLDASNMKVEIFSELFELHEERGNYREALEYHKAFITLQDSLVGLAKSKAYDNILVKYEAEKLKAANEIAEREKLIAQNKADRRGDYLILLSLIAIAFATSTLLFINRIRSKKKAEILSLELKDARERLEIERKLNRSELTALRSQLNPHFIFNTINSVQDLVLQNQTDTSYDYLVNLSKLVRLALEHSEQESISLEQEICFLTHYLNLEKLRLGEDFAYNFDCDEVESMSVKVPPMFLQPFIENALWHGLLPKEGTKELNIKFSQNGTLKCVIEDNGIGRDEALKKKKGPEGTHASFALKAIDKQVDLFRKQFGGEVNYTIDNAFPNGKFVGTRVEVNLPFMTKTQ